MWQNKATLKIGTASGTFLSILPNLDSADILRTIILAGIGATASFLVSLVLKHIFRKAKRN